MAKGIAMALPRHILAMGLAPEYWSVVVDGIVLAFSDNKKWQEANLARRTFANDLWQLVPAGLQRKIRDTLPGIVDGFEEARAHAAASCERAALYVSGDIGPMAQDRGLALGVLKNTDEMSVGAWRDLVGRDAISQELLKFAVSFPYAEARWGAPEKP